MRSAWLVGDLFGLLLTLGFFGWLTWAWRRRRMRRRARQPVEDEPESVPYRVYTRLFDHVVAARDVPALLNAEDEQAKVGRPGGVASTIERIAAAKRAANRYAPAFVAVEERLGPMLAGWRGKVAALLLVDHSGSIKDEMIDVAACVRWLSTYFDEHQVPLAIAGFTTLGWRGGAPRREWIANGRPKRPGRLCALLHLVYRQFDESLADDDWRIMLDPAVLRENIDGEAIEWAANMLATRPEREKLLIVLSDGAPVDDSTIMENGPNFLVRHLRQAIAGLQTDGAVRLGAVGINYHVGAFYGSARTAEDVADLPSALSGVICALLGDRTEPERD